MKIPSGEELAEELVRWYRLAEKKYGPNLTNQAYRNAVASVRRSIPSGFSLEKIERWAYDGGNSNVQSDEARYLGYLFETAPPDWTHNNFGIDVLYWIWCEHVVANRSAELVGRYLFNIEQIDTLDYALARNTSWRRLSTAKPSVVLRSYRILRFLRDYRQGEVEPTLASYALPGVSLSQQRAADYGIVGGVLTQEIDRTELSPMVLCWGRDHTYDLLKVGERYVRYRPYLDEAAALYLTYRGIPQAVISFRAENERTIFVSQLQGCQGILCDSHGDPIDRDGTSLWCEGRVVKVSARGLARLDWQRLLFDALARVAVLRGFSKLVLQGGANNRWVKPDENGEHLSLEDATRAYDHVAMRLGLAPTQGGNFECDLNDYLQRFFRNAA